MVAVNQQAEASRTAPEEAFDLAIVGAGFAGMYMLHRARQMGWRARVFETGSGVGGTWFWNRYPGARCDVESMEYSYQFDDALQQEWEWTERYAAQPEILRYADHVADRYDLRRDIRFDTRVTAAAFDEGTARWRVETAPGAPVSAAFLVMATGCLSAVNRPDFPGLDEFRGPWYHTGNWPHEGVDFSGQRMAVVGTGSSAIQSIPHIARQAEHLYVFQRTPNYAVPARNGPLDPQVQAQFKSHYSELRAKAKLGRSGQLYDLNPAPALETPSEARTREFEARWSKGGFAFLGSFSDLMLKREANDTAADFIARKIADAVRDPAVAKLLTPTSTFACKRLCVEIDYFETYNRPNVTLVDVSGAPIERITPEGLVAHGEAYDVDALVFATGFDAMTGALNRIDIRGTGGQLLREKWNDGPRTYLGLAVAGFPNLFLITGPGSPSVLTNMLPSIEQHVEWIADCIAHLRAGGWARIEPTPDAEVGWVAHVNAVADATLFPSCNSWYLGANVPGKPRVFMPYIGYPAYVEKCDEVVANGYAGFALS